jgi:hypothetical protein
MILLLGAESRIVATAGGLWQGNGQDLGHMPTQRPHTSYCVSVSASVLLVTTST